MVRLRGRAAVATVDQATFPGDGDFALVKYDDPATEAASEVNVGGGQTVAISQAADAEVGDAGLPDGQHHRPADGQVLGLDATVNYPEGTDRVTVTGSSRPTSAPSPATAAARCSPRTARRSV